MDPLAYVISWLDGRRFGPGALCPMLLYIFWSMRREFKCQNTYRYPGITILFYPVDTSILWTFDTIWPSSSPHSNKTLFAYGWIQWSLAHMCHFDYVNLQLPFHDHTPASCSEQWTGSTNLTIKGLCKEKKFLQKSEITMEVGRWVQVSLGFFLGKSSQKTSKPVQMFWSSIPCVLWKVVSYYDLSVLSMSVMGFPKKFGWRVGGWALSKVFFGFFDFFNFAKPLSRRKIRKQLRNNWFRRWSYFNARLSTTILHLYRDSIKIQWSDLTQTAHRFWDAYLLTCLPHHIIM